MMRNVSVFGENHRNAVALRCLFFGKARQHVRKAARLNKRLRLARGVQNEEAARFGLFDELFGRKRFGLGLGEIDFPIQQFFRCGVRRLRGVGRNDVLLGH